jgi:hypothetical protein
VLDDDEACVGRDDEPFGRDEAVRHVTRIFVKDRNRGDQLTNQAQCRVDIDLQAQLARDPQDVGEPRALAVVGHNRQR